MGLENYNISGIVFHLCMKIFLTLYCRYIFGLAFSKLLSLFTGEFCTVGQLRLVNFMFGIGNFLVLHQILQKIHPSESQKDILLKALTLSTFPILYFTFFLFYTDAGSTFFIFISYYFILTEKYFWSSIVHRQINDFLLNIPRRVRFLSDSDKRTLFGVSLFLVPLS